MNLLIVPYLALGVGQASHDLNGEGVWYQERFDHSIDSKSNTFHIGAGLKLSDYLSLEAAYHDFGKTRISADFVMPDPNYNVNSPTGCNGPCNPLAHGVGVGHMKGISLSLLPGYKINQEWKVHGRVGVLFYRREWDERLTCCAPGTYQEGDLYGPRLDKTFKTLIPMGNEYKWIGDSPEVMPISKGRAYIYGVGVSYLNWRLEHMITKDVLAPGSGHTNLQSTTISYVFNF